METKDDIRWIFSLPLVIALFMNLKVTYARQIFDRSYCSNISTFLATDSDYPDNLNAVFRNLSSAAATSTTGYATASAGNGTGNTVYGIVLCRGDQTPSLCSECVNTLVREQPKTNSCPRSKVGVIWYDECMVRYDYQSFTGRMDSSPRYSYFNSQNFPGNLTQFHEILENSMRDLAVETASGGTGKKYGTRTVPLGRSTLNLYLMEQCTPDLSASDCIQCLKIALANITQNKQLGGRVLQPSCQLRYETYQFLHPLPPTDSSTNSKSKTGTGKQRGMRKVWIIIIVLVLLGLFMLLAVGTLFSYKRNRKMKKEIESNNEIKCIDSLQFSYELVQAATENFSDEKRLGKGTSTVVYKGMLPDGQEMAVKNFFSKELEFDNEVRLLANLQHKNLVKLLGFCIKKDARLLIYEFLPNGSLYWFLNDPIKRLQLHWGVRYKIILEIARGLLYLHEDSQVTIILRDLKASNILLSAEMEPKISNFSKATRIHADDPKEGGNSKTKGARGYMPLEGQFSTKSDVFSFGILLLEIINGHTISNFSDKENGETLISSAWRRWSEGEALDVVDKTMQNIENNATQILKCIKIALLCIQADPTSRPPMSIIVFMLNSNIETIAEPSTPAFIPHSEIPLSSSDYSGHSNQGSVNEASMSELGPR